MKIARPRRGATTAAPTLRTKAGQSDLDDAIAALRRAVEEELRVADRARPEPAGASESAWRRRPFRSRRRSVVRKLGAGGARVEEPQPRVSRGRTVNAGNVAFGVLSLMAAGLFALYVVLLLSA